MSGFNWLSYLDVADEMRSGGSEAHYRSAISRAYYGVFVEIRDRVSSYGVQIPRKSVHKFIRDWLSKQRQSQLVRMGSDLSRLWRERNRADYETGEVIDRGRADKSLILARRIESDITINL